MRLVAHHSDRIALSRINTGNARRRPATRGRSTFVPYRTWAESGWISEGGRLGLPAKRPNHPPVELTVAEGVTDIMRFVVGVHHLGPGEQFSHEMPSWRVGTLERSLGQSSDGTEAYRKVGCTLSFPGDIGRRSNLLRKARSPSARTTHSLNPLLPRNESRCIGTRQDARQPLDCFALESVSCRLSCLLTSMTHTTVGEPERRRSGGIEAASICFAAGAD